MYKQRMLNGNFSKAIIGSTLCLCTLPALALPSNNNNLESLANVEVSNKESITGTVIDAKTGDPLVGVTIRLKDKQTGVITDLDGQFKLDCNEGDVLIVSYVIRIRKLR